MAGLSLVRENYHNFMSGEFTNTAGTVGRLELLSAGGAKQRLLRSEIKYLAYQGVL